MGRLTNKCYHDPVHEWCIDYENKTLIVTNDINGDDYVVGRAIDKLAKLEDILEKYGIDSVEELDKRLMKIHNEWCCQEADLLKTEIDRDTWKKACELACEAIFYDLDSNAKELCNLLEWIEDDEKYPIIAKDYFYQQAQKETSKDTKKE